MRTKLSDMFHNEKYLNYHYVDTTPASPPLFVDDVVLS